MTTLEEFLNRCDTYSAKRRIKLSYLSRLLFDDGKRLGALRAGKVDVTVQRLARAQVVLGEFERALGRVSASEHPSAKGTAVVSP